MPIYDMASKHCNYHEEQFISYIQSEKKVKCPECGKLRAFRKVFKKAPDFKWNCNLKGVYDKSKRLPDDAIKGKN